MHQRHADVPQNDPLYFHSHESKQIRARVFGAFETDDASAHGEGLLELLADAFWISRACSASPVRRRCDSCRDFNRASIAGAFDGSGPSDRGARAVARDPPFRDAAGPWAGRHAECSTYIRIDSVRIRRMIAPSFSMLKYAFFSSSGSKVHSIRSDAAASAYLSLRELHTPPKPRLRSRAARPTCGCAGIPFRRASIQGCRGRSRPFFRRRRRLRTFPPILSATTNRRKGNNSISSKSPDLALQTDDTGKLIQLCELPYLDLIRLHRGYWRQCRRARARMSSA